MDAAKVFTKPTKTNSKKQHKYFTRASIKKGKKINYVVNSNSDDSSDEADDDDDDDDEEYYVEEEDEEEEDYDDECVDDDDDDKDDGEEEEDVAIDVRKYRELLADLFPSKFAIKNARRTKHSNIKSNPTDYDADYINPYEYENKNNNAKQKKSTKENKRIKRKNNENENEIINNNNTDTSDEEYVPSESRSETETETDEDEESYEDEEEDEEEEEEEESNVVRRNGKKMPNNIHLMVTIGNRNNRNNDIEDGEYNEDDNNEEDDYYGKYEDNEENEKEYDLELVENIKKEETALLKDETALQKIKNVIDKLTDDEKEMSVFKKMIKNCAKKEKCIETRKSKIDTIVKTQNTRKFQKNLSDKSQFNDVEYFRDKMSQDEQKRALSQLEEIKLHTKIEKPYKLALLESTIPVHVKSIALKKINILKYIDPSSGEFYKIKNWLDTFMQIPFGKYSTLPVTIDDGIEKCHAFMDNAKTILDNAVYGLNDAKIQIMQMIGQWIANPKAFGSAIAIKGPMGTGKTSLVKEGISKILEREFAFIALGGASDGSFLEGHSYTYEGSVWGRIVDILIKSKSMNPVIFFDELDKVSDTSRGDEIIGILTHLTDSSQNSKFHDKYFGDLEFDLSRCLFIFSYNDENKINPILRDRMYRIQTSGYDINDKLIISSQYLIPKIQDQVRFNNEDIIVPDDTIRYIVSKNTESEQGVRNLKRCLEIIYMKLNLYRLLKPGTIMFKSDMMTNVSFPITVTKDIVDHLIKQPEENGNWRQMFL
jgi:ATP-dependent Lon protease